MSTVTPSGETPAWEIRLFGQFALISPRGEDVRVPDRKTEALLAVLVANQELGIERQTAANIVWPGRSPKNLANLRQALTTLRRLLGAAAIESSYSHCRLAESFPLRSDLHQPELRSSVGFMPGHNGEWFDDIRLQTSRGVPGANSEGPIHAYLETLRWLAARDAHGMFGVLGATAGLARSLTFGQLEGLLDTTDEFRRPLGAYSFWRGTVVDDLTQCRSLLRTALREARSTNDLPLGSEVSLELGRAYARTNRPDKALASCDLADEITQRLQSRTSRINALRLRATVQFQWNEPEIGRELLIRLEGEMEDPVELATILSLRAWFEASAGWYQMAEATLDRSLKTVDHSGHFRIDLLHQATKLLLQVAKGPRAKYVPALQAEAARLTAMGCSQYAAYMYELLERIMHLESNHRLAAEMGQAAQRAREMAKMSWTPLEARRIALLQ